MVARGKFLPSNHHLINHLFADLDALHLAKYFVENAIITKECRSSFAPTAEFIDCEQVFDRRILIGCGFGNFRVWRAETMFGKDFLCFLSKEEIYEGISNLARAMLIHIGIYHCYWVVDADR